MNLRRAWIVMASLTLALVAEVAFAQLAGSAGAAVDIGKVEVEDLRMVVDLPWFDRKIDEFYKSYTDEWTVVSPETDPPSYETFMLGVFQETGRRLPTEDWRWNLGTTEGEVASTWLANQWWLNKPSEEDVAAFQEFLKENPDALDEKSDDVQFNLLMNFRNWRRSVGASGAGDWNLISLRPIGASGAGDPRVEGKSSSNEPTKTPQEIIKDAINQICESGLMPKEITVTVGWSGGGTILASVVYEGKEVCPETEELS